MSVDELVAALRPPVISIDDATARMRSIQQALPTADGIAHFNRLYAKVTEEVARRMDGRTFEDPVFIARLDVVFAGRYFRALADFLDGGSPPRAWRALFEARGRPGVSPLRFALAGMNAHINFDLALALVDTARGLRIGLDEGTAQHRDYERINVLLAAVMPAAKAWLATGLIGVADAALGDTDDTVAVWSIERAREAAWVHARALSEIGRSIRLAARLTDTLDRSVGMAGAALLIPQTPFAT